MRSWSMTAHLGLHSSTVTASASGEDTILDREAAVSTSSSAVVAAATQSSITIVVAVD